MKQKRSFTSMVRVVFCLFFVVAASSAMTKTVDDDRAKIRQQSQDVLTRLYEAKPAARDAIANAKGYATFSKWGLTVGPVGGGLGKGLAVSQPAGEEVFMRFVEGSAGLGFGIKKYGLVFVFETESARLNFVNKGWTAGAQATAAAKTSKKGNAYEGASSVSPGVWVYQITEKGLAAEISIKGSKYFKDKSLN
jgi:lipid-binding SYLF domain-containing protein